ncbi:tetratricopeptide repeat protein [Treponema denticola]|uniref:Tetratricopeptide repeat protein n=1 Tax=Treponema denticola TaxID=158 RepID=A0A9Q9EXI5_TREDN|nr:tetratricopeptide repeat protein [Treponema denticola]UTC90227.1 tetratricopeptide repeat protein [Treponema denticola]UTD00422.1 tetratricopeptide repeat protein [Treponema denticola]
MSSLTIILIAAISASLTFLIIFLLKSVLFPKKRSRIEKNLKSGKYGAAIKDAKSILSKNPRDSEARYLLGKAYLADKKIDLAFIEFKTLNKTAVFNNPATEIEFRTIIADLYLKFQQPDEALKEFMLLNKKDPKNPKPYFQAGQIYENKNKSEQAIAYFQKAIEVDSRFAEAYASLGLLLFKANQIPEAEKAIATALKLAPDNSETLYYHGRILKSKKNYAQALSALEKAARKQEIRSKCFFERGCCYLETNSLEKAEFEFTRAIKSSKQQSAPEVLYSRYLLADCYEKQRDIDQAIEQWEAISAVNPKFRNTAQKLAEYSDLHTNDHMKEYLTLIKEDFFKMCRDITEQHFDYPVQALKETKMGCTILAVEKGSEQWLNTRKKPQLLIFSRDGHTITESFLRSVHEEMKKQAIVTSHIITSGNFSPDAVKFAENRPFNLIDRQKLERIVEKVKFTF